MYSQESTKVPIANQRLPLVFEWQISTPPTTPQNQVSIDKTNSDLVHLDEDLLQESITSVQNELSTALVATPPKQVSNNVVDSDLIVRDEILFHESTTTS